MIMSSRYTKQNFLKYSLSTSFMSLWKVAGALLSPKGMTINWYSPYAIIKAVFSRSRLLSLICQYALARSMMVKYFASWNIVRYSLIFGIGYLSISVFLLSAL